MISLDITNITIPNYIDLKINSTSSLLLTIYISTTATAYYSINMAITVTYIIQTGRNNSDIV